MRAFFAVTLLAAFWGTIASAATIGQRAQSVATDAYLYAAVRAKLVTVDADSATAVHVSVDHGVVALSGQARSGAERARYAQAARSVSGVVRVRDAVVVNGNLRGVGEAAHDDALSARVYFAILSQAGSNALRVTVRSRSGIVTLSGNVPSRSIEHTIVSTTAGVSGVHRVIDELRSNR